MKNRKCFVSNSSSSSFIVFGKEPKVPCIKLNLETTRLVVDSINKENQSHADKEPVVEWDGKEEAYLTALLFDGGSFSEPFEELRHADYLCGQMNGEPYAWGDLESDSADIIEIPIENNCSCCSCDPPNSVFINKADYIGPLADPFESERKFIEEVKGLADRHGIKDFLLEVKH